MTPTRSTGILLGLALASLAALAAACGDGASSPSEAHTPGGIRVSSTAFGEGGEIPARYSCDGDEVSPPLTWSGVPSEAAALAIVVDDPDAPSGTFTHWVVLDIPTSTGASDEGGVPEGGVQTENSTGAASWAGPCPPSGTHHYRFTVVALDAETGLAEGAPLDEALAAVEERSIAQGTLTGTYSRD